MTDATHPKYPDPTWDPPNSPPQPRLYTQAELDKRIAQERHDTQLEELKWFKMRLHKFSEERGHEHALFFLRSTVDERIANLQAAVGKEST